MKFCLSYYVVYCYETMARKIAGQWRRVKDNKIIAVHAVKTTYCGCCSTAWITFRFHRSFKSPVHKYHFFFINSKLVTEHLNWLLCQQETRPPFLFPSCNSITLPPSNTCLAREWLHIFRFEKLCHPRQGMSTARTSALQEEPSYIQKIKR